MRLRVYVTCDPAAPSSWNACHCSLDCLLNESTGIKNRLANPIALQAASTSNWTILHGKKAWWGWLSQWQKSLVKGECGECKFPNQERHVGTPRTFNGVHSADRYNCITSLLRQTSTEQKLIKAFAAIRKCLIPQGHKRHFFPLHSTMSTHEHYENSHGMTE